MTNYLSAQLVATLHLMGARVKARDEKGQTTAEYVGILVFVALLVLFVITLNTSVGEAVKGIIDTSFQKITDALG